MELLRLSWGRQEDKARLAAPLSSPPVWRCVSRRVVQPERTKEPFTEKYGGRRVCGGETKSQQQQPIYQIKSKFICHVRRIEQVSPYSEMLTYRL